MRLIKDERGISSLDAAIILIAFVVVASVFAFTMLSAGMFKDTQRNEPPIPEAGYWGIAELENEISLTDTDTVIRVRVEERSEATARIVFENPPYVGDKKLSFVVPDGTGVSYTLHVGQVILQRYRDKFYVRFNETWKVVTSS